MDETNTINVNNPPQNPLRMDPTLTRQIAIEGMTCDNCVAKVEKALRGKTGVINVQVDRQNAVATVTFDSSQTDMPALHDALLAAGYKPTRTAGE
jgi:copper chaperone CopZ